MTNTPITGNSNLDFRRYRCFSKTHIYLQDGSELIFFSPADLRKFNPLFRKELQYIIHSRHKAEIEILSSKQYERPCTREPNSCRYDSVMLDQDNVCNSDGLDGPSGRTSPPYNAAPSSLNSSTTIASLSNFPKTSSKPQHGPHILLVRYLSLKVTNCVLSARRRSSPDGE